MSALYGEWGAPPKGFVARFYDGMRGRRMRRKASTYRALVFLGYVLALVGVGGLALMYREPWDAAWALYGVVSGVAFGFPIICFDARLFRRQPRLETLALLGVAGTMFVWFKVYAEPMFSTREGEFLLGGFYVGWSLSWAIPGNLYYNYKLAMERGLAWPLQVRGDKEAEEKRARDVASELKYARELNRYRLAGAGAVLIGGSAGVMLWMVADISLNPAENDMASLEDWLSLAAVAAPAAASLAVLAKCAWSMEARLMLVAGALSGLSFLGALAVVGEVLVWISYRRFGLPWKAGPKPIHMLQPRREYPEP